MRPRQTRRSYTGPSTLGWRGGHFLQTDERTLAWGTLLMRTFTEGLAHAAIVAPAPTVAAQTGESRKRRTIRHTVVPVHNVRPTPMNQSMSLSQLSRPANLAWNLASTLSNER